MVFAGQDLDPRGAADTVGHAVGPEDCVGHRQHPGVADHPGRGRRVAQHAGDAQGAVAVEVVLLQLAAGVELGTHFGGAGVDGGAIEGMPDDGGAGLAQHTHHRIAVGVVLEDRQFHGRSLNSLRTG